MKAPRELSREEIARLAYPGETWEVARRRLQGSVAKLSPSYPSLTPPRLPIWGDSVRCLPNEIVRSALFTARNRRTPRAYFMNASIHVIGGGEILYTGQELRQDDENVWLHLIHLARLQDTGHIVEFKPRPFCFAVGFPDNGDGYRHLRSCLTRLQATALSLCTTRFEGGLSLSMLPFFRWKGDSGNTLARYQVSIAPELVEWFGDIHYTIIEWRQRIALPCGLASWLHGYYASHKVPLPIKLSTIRSGAGLEAADSDKFKQEVRRALHDLTRVGFLKSWKIEHELVRVERA